MRSLTSPIQGIMAIGCCLLSATFAVAVPSVTTGLIGAFDGTSVSTSGSSVTSWNDQSGNLNHAAQNVAGNQPIFVPSATPNGTAAIQFDGVDDFLDIMPNPSDFDGNEFSWYVVYLPTAADNNRVFGNAYSDIDPLIGGDQYSGEVWANLAGSNGRNRAVVRDLTNGFHGANTPNGLMTTEDFFVTGGIWDGSNTTTDNVTSIVLTGPGTRETGTTVGYDIDGNSEPSGHLRTRIGAGIDFNDAPLIETPFNAFAGQIAEVLFYNRVLNASEQTMVEDYLFSKHFGTGPTSFSWDSADSGNWLNAANWTDTAFAPPNNNNVVAVFGDAIGDTTRTVYMEEQVTVNGVAFANTFGGSYIVAGSPGVTLAATNSLVAPSITVSQGNHQFQAPVSIEANTNVSVASGSLDFNNEIDLNGHTLSLSGNVNINGSTVGGGSVSSLSGVLGTAGTTAIAGNLLASDTMQFDLGAANVDYFDVNGTATLSGTLDVILEPGYAPSGSYTLLSAASLNAAGLTLDPSDTSTFSLSTQGNDLVLSVIGTASGDFDGDGDVDGRDFLIWQRGGSTNGPLSPVDLAAWQSGYGTPQVAATAAVPEPSSVVLLALVSLSVLVRNQPKQRLVSK